MAGIDGKRFESRRDGREDGLVRAISAAPSGLSCVVFTPTVKDRGLIFLSSRWDLICAANTPHEKATPAEAPACGFTDSAIESDKTAGNRRQ